MMRKLLRLIPALMPVVTLASEADEPSMMESVIPFSVIAILLAVIGLMAARKKK